MSRWFDQEDEGNVAAFASAQDYLLFRLNAGLQGRELLPRDVAWSDHTRMHRYDNSGQIVVNVGGRLMVSSRREAETFLERWGSKGWEKVL